MEIKKFIKDHKRDIVLVVSSTIIGTVAGKCMYSYKDWLRGFNTFGVKAAFLKTDDPEKPFNLFVGTSENHGMCMIYNREQFDSYMKKMTEIQS